MFVKSGIMNGGFCPTLKSYDRAAKKSRTSRIEDCEMREQRVYTSREVVAEKKRFNWFCNSRR